MAKYRKKPAIIEATRWFKNGDHPDDGIGCYTPDDGARRLGEGKVVRYYQQNVTSMRVCQHCRAWSNTHGWIDTLEGGHIVCPGDWVITEIAGEHYPCKPEIFAASYDLVVDVSHDPDFDEVGEPGGDKASVR